MRKGFIGIVGGLCMAVLAARALGGDLECHNPVTSWAGAINAEIDDTVIDATGAVIVTGFFLSPADFDPTDGVDQRTPTIFRIFEPEGRIDYSIDIFISKYAADGSYLWTRTIGGIWNDFGAGVAVDSGDNIYVAGTFRGTVDFDPTEGVDEHTSQDDSGESIPPYNAFLTKLLADGSYEWTATFGVGQGDSFGRGVALDGDDNIVVVGSFLGTLDFDPTVGVDLIAAPEGQRLVYVTKLTSDGSYLWTRAFGGPFGTGIGLAVDDDGNIVVSGTFRWTADFDPGPGVDEHTATNAIGGMFVSKYTPGGAYQWTGTFPGTRNGVTNGKAITVDGNGNVLFAGTFAEPADFDPTAGVDWRVPNDDADPLTPNGDIFVTKLSASGAYQWTYTAGGLLVDAVGGIGVDEDGAVVLTGRFTDVVDFDPGPGVDERYAPDRDDIFVTRLESDGSYAWTRTFGPTSATTRSTGRDVALDGSGGVVISGTGFREIDFDPGCGVNETEPDDGIPYAFTMKLVCVEPTGDFDGSGAVDLRDAAHFMNCFTGPAPAACFDGCEVFDFTQDDAIDLDDAHAFASTLNNPL